MPKGYNPSQPREPAGSSDGGQWTATQASLFNAAMDRGAGLEKKQSIRFADTNRYGGDVAGSAMGDSIIINRDRYQSMTQDGKKHLIAHELAHNIVEDKILQDPIEWERASNALLLGSRETPTDVYFNFILGQSRIGEAMVETIAVYANEATDPMANFKPTFTMLKPSWSPEQWKGAMDWAKHALEFAGTDKIKFMSEVNRLMIDLDRQNE